MSFTITTKFNPTTTTPVNCLGAKITNPTSIEAGSSASLDFYADGTYYLMYPTSKASTAVTISGASLKTWTCASPYKDATLVIENPTSNVEITINAKQSISPTAYGKPFEITSKAPIDIRLVLSKEQMKNIKDARQPDIYFAICKDDGNLYIYDKSLPSNESTGKFILYESGNDKAQLIKGYYTDNKFYTDSTYQVEIVPNEKYVYIDKNSDKVYYYDNNQYKCTQKNATEYVAGIMKLYDTHGQNTDGTMTQKSISDSIEDIKFSIETSPDEDGDGELENILVLDKPW